MTIGQGNNNSGGGLQKLLPVLYVIGAGIICTAVINKWKCKQESELRHQRHRRLLEDPSKPVDFD